MTALREVGDEVIERSARIDSHDNSDIDNA
jgi:hypothetical protein